MMDYDLLTDFAGFDGHTPCYTVYDADPRRFWGTIPSLSELRDRIDRDTIARLEAEALKIVNYRPLQIFDGTAECAPYASRAQMFCGCYPPYAYF